MVRSNNFFLNPVVFYTSTDVRTDLYRLQILNKIFEIKK